MKIKRFIKDVVYIITGNTLRLHNKVFKHCAGQWDGLVLIEKRTTFTTWLKVYPSKIKRRIKSVLERKYLLERYYTKELGRHLLFTLTGEKV